MTFRHDHVKSQSIDCPNGNTIFNVGERRVIPEVNCAERVRKWDREVANATRRYGKKEQGTWRFIYILSNGNACCRSSCSSRRITDCTEFFGNGELRAYECNQKAKVHFYYRRSEWGCVGFCSVFFPVPVNFFRFNFCFKRTALEHKYGGDPNTLWTEFRCLEGLVPVAILV